VVLTLLTLVLGNQLLSQIVGASMRGLPCVHIFTSQQEFLDEFNRRGFAEMYDFAYPPRN
jgi:hypothetical protein